MRSVTQGSPPQREWFLPSATTESAAQSPVVKDGSAWHAVPVPPFPEEMILSGKWNVRVQAEPSEEPSFLPTQRTK